MVDMGRGEMEERDRDGRHGEGRDGGEGQGWYTWGGERWRRGTGMVDMGRGEMEERDRDGRHGERRDGGRKGSGERECSVRLSHYSTAGAISL